MDLKATHPIRARWGEKGLPATGRKFDAWAMAAALTLLTSGAAWASLPRPDTTSRDGDAQWRALGVAPLGRGGSSGLRMIAEDTALPVSDVPVRDTPFVMPEPVAPPAAAIDNQPLRIRGSVSDGLYTSLRMAGASPEAAAQYLVAMSRDVDVGEIGRGSSFDLVLGQGSARPLLYAGLSRPDGEPLQLVRWNENGRDQWVDAAHQSAPQPTEQGMMMPVAGHITSTFGNRFHPILRFFRFHAGLDIGAAWGSPIVAAADGQVTAAGWAGGYGREVQIAHSGGLRSIYGHMSEVAVAAGTFVRRGEVIGYVGSSGLSTGPHLHFEVRQGGTPIDPLSARIISAPAQDPGLIAKVKARLAALLRVGTKA